MKYNFKHENFNNVSIFEDNKLEARSYHIPFASLNTMIDNDYLTERYHSDMVTMLNGKWGFKYYRNYIEVGNDFDLGNVNFDRANVPSCLQFDGVEKPVYVNQRYEFPTHPPRIPKDTPLAIYSNIVEMSEVSGNEIITFLGVCSCLELYVNGEYIGYSEGSHNTCEFNITKALRKGANEIVCLVYKWCNGTYLECQDMFRHNGIFRDVYITHYGDSYIYDFVIEPIDLTASKYELYLGCSVVGDSAYSIRYIVKNQDGNVLHTAIVNGGDKIRLILDDVREWSSELPYLYSLSIELIDSTGLVMCVNRDFGLKREVVRGNMLFLNDKLIKLKGVNHHDTNQSKGFCMDFDDYTNDITAMKECNVNAVRMSHYPPDPIFIMMCEHYGMYVVDEADIETHGMTYGVGINPINKISSNKKWAKHYWDRVYRMFARDKNSVAVVMWSLGNESGGYKCQDYCYDKLKELSTIPIHYEGVIRTKRFAYDVISEMYTSTEKLEKYNEGTSESKYYDKPFMLCEYAHAMGVGPGDLEKYWELIYNNASFIGAFVWEWKDHAICHDESDNMPDSKYNYTYGGDHDEVKHDGNFCVDGLLYPDGTLHTGAKCLKAVYSPVRARKIDNRCINIINRNLFIDTSDILISWVHYIGGVARTSGIVDTVIPPSEGIMFCPDIKMADISDNYIVLTYREMATGKIISRDSIMLREYIPSIKVCPPAKIINTGDNLRVQFNNGGNLSLSIETGLISTYMIDGVQLLDKSRNRSDLKCLSGNIYRACIDNYRNLVRDWDKRGLDKSTYKLELLEYGLDGTINTIHKICVGRTVLAEVATDYQISECGSMTVNVTISTSMAKSIDLPKFGMSIDVNGELDNVDYYGLGECENYSDMLAQSVMGVWSCSAADMFENYIRPQDNGNRSEVRWMSMTNDDGVGLRFTAVNKPFNFSILPVSLKELCSAKHIEDVKHSSMYNVNIDAFVRGVGSNSCGPDTRVGNRYVLGKGNPLSYSFHIQPMPAKDKRES